MTKLLTLLAATVLALSACGASDEPAPADVAFAQQMIPHHEQAVEMAAMVGPDSSPEVRSLAERIAAAQGPEIATMRDWLREWDEPEPGHHDMDAMGDMAGMMSEQDMADLSAASGPDFDSHWLQMMIDHHEGAISMSETVLEDGEDPDVRALANDVIAGQRAEITEMRELQR